MSGGQEGGEKKAIEAPEKITFKAVGLFR